jgi:peptidylprolyl isomerase
MSRGDSASFIVNIDSTFKMMFRQPTLPAEFHSTDVMRFEVRLDDFYPESEYMKRMVLKMKEFMKKNNPEKTAAAEQELANYLVQNNITVEPTATGLYYVMTQEGNGEKPEVGQVVKVHYTGKLLDGTVFDSSVERGEPISKPIGVGQLIPGWDEGILMMSKGEKGMLYIPYYLGYGDRDMGEIPPFSNLVFEVELVDIEGR